MLFNTLFLPLQAVCISRVLNTVFMNATDRRFLDWLAAQSAPRCARALAPDAHTCMISLGFLKTLHRPVARRLGVERALLRPRQLGHLVQISGRPYLLFVAHRQNILDQILATFRQVLCDDSFGKLLMGRPAPQTLAPFISLGEVAIWAGTGGPRARHLCSVDCG